MSLVPYLERLVERRHLTAAEAEAAMHTILGGQANHPQIAALLMALRVNGETVEELVGFARAMRQMAAPVNAGLNGEALLDTCGTGGDGSGTFNISTVAAFVVAGAGVRVAKHGNRSITAGRAAAAPTCWNPSACASLFRPPKRPAPSAKIGIGFLFAPAVHTAMKHAQPVRLDLKFAHGFQSAGPVDQSRRRHGPAGGNALGRARPNCSLAPWPALGLQRGFVVHGSDGLDEITTTGPTLVFEIRDGKVERRTLEPRDFAVPRADPQELKGGGKERNLEIAKRCWRTSRAGRDIVLVNAAAALVAADRAETFLAAMPLAAQSLASGAARRKLEALARFTQELAAQP